MDEGVQFLAGVVGRPGGKSGETEICWFGMGGEVAGLYRGPLGRLRVDGDEGDVVGQAVSEGRGDVRAMSSGAGGGAGDGSLEVAL
jgi:hypothetical protein